MLRLSNINCFQFYSKKPCASKFGINFDKLEIIMPNLVSINFVDFKLIRKQLTGFRQVVNLDPKGFEPAGNFSFSVTAVRIRFHTH